MVLFLSALKTHEESCSGSTQVFLASCPQTRFSATTTTLRLAPPTDDISNRYVSGWWSY